MPEKYSEVMQLGRHSDVVLLRETASDRLVVRRIVGSGQAEIYGRLKDMAGQYNPAIYSIADTGNRQYEILEEYIEGKTLEEMLQEKEKMPEPLAALYITQLCEALEKLHKAGLVHRDIKPSNIIITPDGRLYMIDFDIARIHKTGRDADTEILGTQGYAAPEQFGFHQTDAQADIYSAGVLLNKLLTGKLPHECLAKGSIAYVVKRCLQMDTARRYRSAKALGKALRPYLPQGHPHVSYILRQIPGFRSFTVWKMVLAGTIYAFLLVCIVAALPEVIAAGTAVRVWLVVSVLYYVFLFFFVFDIFQIRSRIKWLEKSRGRWNYLLKCILLAVVILIMASVIGGWLEK